MSDVGAAGARGGVDHPRWADLPIRARAWRLIHAAWAAAQLAALGKVWLAVATRRREPADWASAAFLAAEGAGLVIGRGNCPVGPRQEAWGDPVPFFELLLPPRAAKAAIPVLALVAGAAIAGLVARGPGLRLQAPR